jgi:osmoprotectant transport system ATP-binding protein
MKEPVIEISEVTKTYDGLKLAVDNVSLSVANGEFLTIIGPSGCGKTTLLRLINGMTDFESGSIKVLNKEMHFWDKVQLRRKIGYVIQGAGLFPHLTVKQNMQFVLNISGMAEDLQEERVMELAQIIGFSKSQLKEYPNSLSGGQQQRVGVARALAMKPQIILLDEPLGSLDNVTRRKIQKELRKIQHKTGATFVMVTHDLREAFDLGTRVAIMNKGRIEQYDIPAIIKEKPANDWVKQFTLEY